MNPLRQKLHDEASSLLKAGMSRDEVSNKLWVDHCQEAKPEDIVTVVDQACAHFQAQQKPDSSPDGSFHNANGAAGRLVVPQPNASGEFATPLDGALFMASFGIPQTPLRGKAPFLGEWQKKASSDPEQLRTWYREFKCNFGSVALRGGFFVFETDSASVREHFEKQGGKFTSRLMVASRPDGTRGHRYYKWIEGIENIGQNAALYGDFSVRADAEQCVSPGSVHPETGSQYRMILPYGSPEPPTAQEVAFWRSEKKVEQKNSPVIDESAPIPQGQRNTTLTSIAGALRAKGLNEEEIDNHLQRVNRERCDPSLTEEEVRRIAHSIGSKPYKPDVFAEDMAARAAEVKRAQEQAALQEPEIEKSEAIHYPKFPEWVMKGTSLYDGFVKPTYDSSDKYPELLFMPALVLFVNYISAGRVRIKMTPVRPNIFLGIIGPYGKFYKSTACEDAQEYFIMMGLCTKVNSSLKSNENGKTVVISPGSTEGLGIKLGKLNANHALIYNDELSKFIAKANVENSSFISDMLSFYEAREYGNQIKRDSESFGFNAGKYCFSWIWCTTDRKFPGLWSKLPGDHVDLDNRMLFLLTPETPRMSGQRFVQANVGPGALETKRRIEAAMAIGEFEYADDFMIDSYFEYFADDPRDQALLQTLALYFAIDLNPGLNDAPFGTIGFGSVERAAELVKYRRATRKFLDIADVAETAQGRLQKRIIRELRRQGGQMRYRDLYRSLDALSVGTDFWNKAFQGLVNSRIIAHREAAGGGRAQQAAMVYLLKNDLTQADEASDGRNDS